MNMYIYMYMYICGPGGPSMGFPTLNSMPNIRIIIWGVWRPHSTPKIGGVGYSPPHAHAMPAIQLESPT